MTTAALEGFEKPRLKALLDHFAAIEDPREPWRVAHPLPEVLLLVVCGTICDCEREKTLKPQLPDDWSQRTPLERQTTQHKLLERETPQIAAKPSDHSQIPEKTSFAQKLAEHRAAPQPKQTPEEELRRKMKL